MSHNSPQNPVAPSHGFPFRFMLAGLLMIGLVLLTAAGRSGVVRPSNETMVTVSAVEEVQAQADAAAAQMQETLNPRMRAALDYTARRYRVSSEALQPIFEAAQSAAKEFGIDPLLVIAVIAIESRFNPFSESTMGAQGLMQVIPRFHQDKLPADAGKLPLFDPVINVQVGTHVLHESIRRNGDLINGLQQFAGALSDPDQGYANKVLAEKQRLENAIRRRSTELSV